MQTTSGLLSDLGQRLGTTGVWLLLLLGAVVALAAGLAIVAAGDVMAASSDPVQVAPFRWFHRG